MAHRADPENIYLGRRAAIRHPHDVGHVGRPAELLVREWEAKAKAEGTARLERTFWEGAAEWTSARAWPEGRS